MDIEWINEILYMHELASEHAEIGNHVLAIIHWFVAALTIFWTGFLVVILWKFRRKKHPSARYHGITSHFSTHLEVGVVIVEVVLLLGFAYPLWAKRADIENMPKGENVVKLRAVGEQFRWTFHYAGADKMLGITNNRLITGGSNGIGLDKNDPNSLDDFVSLNELVVPIGRPVIIQVTSKDVIHGLAIVPFFSQQDAIPGTEIPMWFVPSKVGEWDIVCAQLCGASHAQMVASVVVMEQKEYDEWHAAQNPMLPKE